MKTRPYDPPTFDTSPSAFPWQAVLEPGSNRPDGTRLGPNEREVLIQEGMSLRDYFAGQALAGMIAAEGEAGFYRPETAAVRSYEVADAMLAARSNGRA